jgi:hypothetical protein
MLAPDGTPGYVPADRVNDALKDGGKLSVRMLAPDGTPGDIPLDNQDAAQKDGGTWAVHPDNDALKSYITSHRPPETHWSQSPSASVGDMWGIFKGVPGITPEGTVSAAKGIWNHLPPVKLTDAVQQTLPILHAYETARADGSSIEDSIKASDAVAKQHAANISPLPKMVAAFRANPTKETGRALIDAVLLSGSLLDLGAPEVEATSAADGGVMAATAARTPEELAAVRPPNPFRQGTAATSVAETPKPGLLRSGVNKFTGGDIQPNLQAGIRDTWNNVADTEGVPRPKVGASVRDMGEQVGDAVLARSKANYKLIDDATSGRFSGVDQALKTVNQDLRSVTNDTEEQALVVRKTRLELQMNQMMDDAAAKGVPKSTVDAAKSDFKKAQAIYDTSAQQQMATKGVRPNMTGSDIDPEVVDPKSFRDRMNKLYTNGRLELGVGEDAANDFIGHAASALKRAKDVVRNKWVAGPVAAGIPTAGGVVLGVKKLLE